ncbi:MAG: C/D box methylation guide ribonucleoprotein complex aNOP56 subunit [Candidatus Bathyarchaeia archaeon]
MKASIVETSFGILVFNEKNELEGQTLFPRKAQETAKILAKIEAGKMPEEMAELIRHMRKHGFNTFIFENPSLAKEAREKTGVEAEVEKPSAAGEHVRSHLEELAMETGFVKSADEFKLWMHNVTMELAKLHVKSAVEKRDLIVAQAIQTLDDLDRAINLLMSRAREWYGVHFPELDRLLEKHETFARLIVNLGSKDNFTLENLLKEDIPQAKAEAISKTAEKSMGADLSEADLSQIQTLCHNLLNLYDVRQSLETYLDKTMEEVAPNTKFLVGPLLAARLIAISGGLKNLAARPASTIQVLGAEKALFRSLKTGTRPPKHGIIFQHATLHDAKRWQRGKIARALAGKLAIAVRADAFGKRDIRDQLKADLEQRLEEIREKYAEPPPLEEKKPKREKRKNEDRRARFEKRRKHRRER